MKHIKIKVLLLSFLLVFLQFSFVFGAGAYDDIMTKPVDVSKPDTVIGTGTPESCTAEAFIAAVAKGGIIVFNGGNKPFTIVLDRPAKIYNDQKPYVVIDGGGLVTLSGGGKTRILYMNTCDKNQVWTTPRCDNQDHPQLTVQNISFTEGNSSNEKEYDGGGAIYASGGRFRAINCNFTKNICASTGPDVGGGAIRVFQQYNNQPAYLVNCVFGGAPNLGNKGSNGGAISSIGVSWTIIDCVFSYNEALGRGGNPSQPGTPGGGSGGAVYNDGNKMTLNIISSVIENNKVNAFGSGIFFVSNNHTGNIILENSKVENNTGGSWYPSHPNISMHSDTPLLIKGAPATTGNLISPSTVAIDTDGSKLSVQAFNFNGNNYFKLRDIATLTSAGQKKFQISYDNTDKAVVITTNTGYTPVGGELSGEGAAAFKYAANKPTIKVDGKIIQPIQTHLINGYNYFMLRDIGRIVDFGITWNQDTKTIIIDSSKPYSE